jgi:diguanylate cyclase (GGDEF)-like protein
MAEDEGLHKKIADLEEELKQSRAREKSLGDLLEKKLNEIYVHYHVSRTVGSLLDLPEMLLQVFGSIRKNLTLDRISVYLFDEPREKLELVYYDGTDLARAVTLDPGEGTPGRIVESGEHVHIHDTSVFYETFNDFIHHPKEEKRDGSFIGIALKVHKTTIGVIGMDNGQKYGLTVDDMDFMAILSHQLAAGIEMSLLFDKISLLSQRDGLTGLYNHRMFKEKLTQELSRRGRNNKPLSLMMIDIDHFKQFNDSYGHQAGDAVLKQLAAVITGQTRGRTIDVCCRYGGEEFTVIMPELDLSRAVTVAERLRKTVEDTPFFIKDREEKSKVTISLGVASVAPEEDANADDLVKKADDALYQSKRLGRNRVSAAPGSASR